MTSCASIGRCPRGLGERLAEAVRQQEAAPAPVPVSSGTWLRVAAGLLVGLGAAMWWWWPTDVPSPPLDADALYASFVSTMDAGVDGNACAVVPEEGVLAAQLSERFEQPIEVESFLPLAGPFDCEEWPGACGLTAQVGPDPVVLLLGERSADPGLQCGPSSTLNVNRREDGDLVLYELTRGAASCFPMVQFDLSPGPD